MRQGRHADAAGSCSSFARADEGMPALPFKIRIHGKPAIVEKIPLETVPNIFTITVEGTIYYVLVRFFVEDPELDWRLKRAWKGFLEDAARAFGTYREFLDAIKDHHLFGLTSFSREPYKTSVVERYTRRVRIRALLRYGGKAIYVPLKQLRNYFEGG